MRPGSRRNAVTWAMTEKRYNQKRACALAGIDPRVSRRKSKRPADTDLRDRLKELSSERRRFGYRAAAHSAEARRLAPSLQIWRRQIACRATGKLEEAVSDLPRRRVNSP